MFSNKKFVALGYVFKKIKNFFAKPKNQTIITWIICALLLSIGMALIALHRNYTSDDVVIQTTIYQHFHLPGQDVARLGEDNYIIKVPFYIILNLLFDNSRSVLMFTSFVFSLSGMALFLYSTFYFLRRFNISNFRSKLSLIWLFSLSSPIVFFFILINPNLRNLEIGLAFLGLTLFAKYLDGSISFKRRVDKFYAFLLSAAFGLFLYSDPFFLVMLWLPLFIFFTALFYFGCKTVSRQKLTRVLAFMISSLLLMAVFHLSLNLVDIYSRPLNSGFINYTSLWRSIDWTILTYCHVFGIEFWGKAAATIYSIRNLLNALVVIFFVVAPFLMLRSKSWSKRDPWWLFLILQPYFITLVFIFSQNVVDNGNGSGRFIVMLPFYIPLILALSINELLTNKKLRDLFTLALLASIALNSAYLTHQSISIPEENPNSQNYSLIKTLEKHHLYKGFGGYWDSHINTYLSNNTINVIPVNCLHIQHFLMDDKTLTIPANKTFYIYDSQVLSATCPQKTELDRRLGQPSEVLDIKDTDKKILVYDYDISSKLVHAYFY